MDAWIGKLALVLSGIGALAWGLVGVFKWNLVETLLGTGMLSTIVYGLIGVSGLYVVYNYFQK